MEIIYESLKYDPKNVHKTFIKYNKVGDEYKLFLEEVNVEGRTILTAIVTNPDHLRAISEIHPCTTKAAWDLRNQCYNAVRINNTARFL